MAVKIGSARIDERGRATGGKAGDQTGRECATQNWYKHGKGWQLFRAKDSRVREYIAKAMEMACANNSIGYDQAQRLTLYTNVKPYNFDPSKTTKAVETDCSALVRVCILYALRKIGNMSDVGNFRTATESSYLMKTGLFDKYTDSKHCATSKYLARGDILCTPAGVSGHTVVVLNNGINCDAGNEVVASFKLGDREISNGTTGEDVKELQIMLIGLGYDLGAYGADGDCGDMTEQAIEAFQRDQGLDADGIAGILTITAIINLTNKKEDDSIPDNAKFVRIINGNCYVRKEPDSASDALGVAVRDTELEYRMQSVDGWHSVIYRGSNGWVSSKYSEVH